MKSAWKSSRALASSSLCEPLTRAQSRLALARARILRPLQSQIAACRAEIEKLFADHPDSGLFGSLPGAGPKLAPRLFGEIGTDRARFEDPAGLPCLAGTAPVSYPSGQIHKVHLRRQCHKPRRHAVHLWANLSRQSCPWAAVYDDQLRERGKSHACAASASAGSKSSGRCGRPAPPATPNSTLATSSNTAPGS